ncbi:hypothetical protein BDC45DRAFT_535333 [Circinella umbellata]|nr:hypothetical protein BDC45DRAFT_535333 [Circinella umbellata]
MIKNALSGMNSMLDLSDLSTNSQLTLWTRPVDRRQKAFIRCELFDILKSLIEITKEDGKEGYKMARIKELDATDFTEELYIEYMHTLSIMLMTDLYFLLTSNGKFVNGEKSIYNDIEIMTEYDHVIKIWGELFEILFKDTGASFIWGASGVKIDSPTSPNKIFKVDMKVVLYRHEKTYPLGTVEFGPRLV